MKMNEASQPSRMFERRTLEGINLFDAEKQTFYYTDDNFGERNIYGPRYFLGLRGKF